MNEKIITKMHVKDNLVKVMRVNGVDYISIYSTANDIFYELCFPKSELFLEYVRIHGRPISNIPTKSVNH